MFKAFIVFFAILASTFGLAVGAFAIAVGETAVPPVAIAVLSGIFLAAPASWYLAESHYAR